MKKLLLLQSREDKIADTNEYQAILQYGNLVPAMVREVKMISENLEGINVHDYAAIMVTGGPFDFSKPDINKSERQHYIEKFLEQIINTAYEHDIPYLGICYGLGVLVGSLGGKVSHDHPENVGPVRLKLTAEGKKDWLFYDCNAADVIVGHKDSVEALPDGAVLLASSENCGVQAIRVNENLYGVQFHPELDIYGLSVRLNAYRHHGYFDPSEYDEIMNIVGNSSLDKARNIITKFCTKYCS